MGHNSRRKNRCCDKNRLPKKSTINWMPFWVRPMYMWPAPGTRANKKDRMGDGLRSGGTGAPPPVPPPAGGGLSVVKSLCSSVMAVSSSPMELSPAAECLHPSGQGVHALAHHQVGALAEQQFQQGGQPFGEDGVGPGGRQVHEPQDGRRRRAQVEDRKSV